MARTTADLVKGVLGDNYGPLRDGSLPDLTPHIDSAAALVDRLVAAATAEGVPLTGAEAELVERWLAADNYTTMDPLYTSRSTLSASGSFAQRSYKDKAIELDPSGCLNSVLSKQRAGGAWLGRSASERTQYWNR